MPFDTEVGLGPGDIVLEWDPALPHGMGHSRPPHFSAHVYCAQTVAHINTAELLYERSRDQWVESPKYWQN